MEGLQLTQWLVGPSSSSLRSECSIPNKLLTLIAYLLIWLQPLLFSLMGAEQRLSDTWVRGDYFLFSTRVSLVALGAAMLNTFLSWLANTAVTVSGTPSNFGQEMCTTVGRYGHLSWSFPIYHLDTQPSYFVYLALIAMCIVQYPKAMKYTMGLGWFAMLLVATFMVRGSEEIPAFWCLLSVFAGVPILIYVLTEQQERNPYL